MRVFCEVVASLVGYEFDDLDWLAVETALPGTDDEQEERWYDYPLVGSTARLDLKLARSVGGSEISVEAKRSDESRSRRPVSWWRQTERTSRI
ncbi:hypothetical protein [Thermoactinospora rubra]|uniref:hypothetical protein n=1 Tax=Thermoactinospora rubra TaxID=1088767 RepID=UPI00117F2092|nr:hypothetical protein [Thermoactinospora rubra]